jgi:small-conductance mechanosensitive channel
VIAGVILSYFAALIVTAIVLRLLGGMSRVAHHFLNPMMMWIAALIWVLAVWALYRMVLGSNLLIRTANAIEGVLIAMIAVCLIYCGRVFIVSVFEMHVFRSVQPGVREGRVMDRFVHLLWAGAKPTKEAVAYIRQLTKISSTPFLGLMQVVGASHTISTLGLRSLAPTFPAKTSVDDEVRGVCGTLVDSLFEMCGNPPHINEAALTALVTDRSNAIGGMGARKTRYVFEVLDLEMSDKITPSIAREAFDDILSRRLTLIGDIRGHDLLVRILSDLLGFVVAIISIFLLLGAIGVDLLAMLVPVSALFFAFAFAFSGPIAEFVRGFIFVFFRRPYELEDWVTVDDGPELIVKSVSVLVTEFETLGGYAVSYSNSVLAGKKLGNMRRSTSVCQAQFYTIRAGLSQADIAAVKDTLREFFEASPKLYYPAATALISSLPHDAGMQLKIVYTVKCRWNQKGVYSEAGSLVHLRIVDIFKARGIEWGVNYKVQKLD